MKLPRDISGEEMVRILKRLGFLAVRQRGSHIRMEGRGRKITVPSHGAILPGTLQSILEQAGVSMEEFLKHR